jgi:uncharacterized membrane protein YeaQ/YmgE (transglycosylase-associated protein family)
LCARHCAAIATRGDQIMLSAGAVFLILLIIGIAAGILFDRFAGPGWLTRQIAGSNRMIVTSALVGTAGSFVGYHLAVLIGIIGFGALLGAVIGALVVLWAWRMMR